MRALGLRIALLSAVTASLLLCVAARASAELRPRGPLCGAGRTVVESKQARVLVADSSVGGCMRGQRRSWLIFTATFANCWHQSCVMNAPTLAGRWFAYGSEATDDGRDPDSPGWYWSFIKVVDLSATNRSESQWIFDAGLNDGNPYSNDGHGPVQAIALATTGSLAFIVKDYRTPEIGYRVYSALRTADPQYQRPVELGRGRTIVPRTLKLVGGTATWKQGGSRKIARLR